MRSYITKPQSIKKSDIVDKYFSFLPSEHKKICITNLNQKSISELIEFENAGEQIDVLDYLNFKTDYYLGTISCMSEIIYDESKGENIAPKLYFESNKKLKQGDIIISRNASLGKVSYFNSSTNVILNGGLSYLRFTRKYKWYAVAFFIVRYGAEYLACVTSGGGIQQNVKRKTLLDMKIPFPTTKNNAKPEEVEALVSLLVQNIIDKEEQIKLKNAQIDALIEKELRENQKQTSSFQYSYPKISEMKAETRLDTGLYTPEFKKTDFLIKNYQGGVMPLKDFVVKFYSGSTPEFFEKQYGDYPYFVRPTEYNDKRVFTDLKKIHFDPNIKKHRIDNAGGIILPRKGGTNAILKPEGFRVLIGDSVKFATFKDIDISFLASFLSSGIVKNQLEKVKAKTNGGSLTEDNLNNIPIPNFPEEKQKEIARLYYNKLPANGGLNLQNYLEREAARNKELGIFQLNMEVFSLREKLEEVIHKIIMEEEIKIQF